MKIVIVRTGPLFGWDEGRLHAEGLRAALAAQGHHAELTTLPFSPRIAELIPETAAYRLLDLRGIDLCIAIGPFSWALKHPNKRVWMFSRYSPFYEHWDTAFGAAMASHSNLRIRESVLAMDRVWLGEARAVFAGSQQLAEQLGARLLRPPVPDALRADPSAPGDFLVCAGPLADEARVGLAVKAIAKARSGVKLAILGFEARREEREHLQKIIAESGAASRVELELNPSLERIRDRLRASLGLIALPFRAPHADVFARAAAAMRRPILAARDSGELASLAHPQCVAEPDELALAHAIDLLFAHRGNAAHLAPELPTPSWETVAKEMAA